MCLQSCLCAAAPVTMLLCSLALLHDLLPSLLPLCLSLATCADLFAGSHDALTLLSHKIIPGTVIVFDELLNYKRFREHEVSFACFHIPRHSQLGCGLLSPAVAMPHTHRASVCVL